MPRYLALVLVLCANFAVAAATTARPAKPNLDFPAVKPSENKGRPGTYQCKTSFAGNDYWVYVPKSYSAENPAGIHIFFHGMGCSAMGPDFASWSKYFLEPHNLIGINMQYLDNSPRTGVPEKTAAARQAVAQLMADYKIIAGRGVMCCYSAGGNPQDMWYQNFSKTRGDDWPFCHLAMYSSAMSPKPSGSHCPMSWCWVLGEKEFNLGGPGICSMVAANLMPASATASDGDVRMMVLKGKGHDLGLFRADEYMTESAAMFHRSDIALAPFLYEPDYAEPELVPIMKQANKLLYNGLATNLDRVLKTTKSEAVRTKATALRARVDARITAVVELARELCANDPVLANYYSRKFVEQLNGLPEGNDVRAMANAITSQKDFPRLSGYGVQLKDKLKDMFANTAQVKAANIPFLEEIKANTNSKSQLGRVAAEYLELK